jgi:Raf kinase inhibitor-like YbhB/YbcL family protein
MKRLSNIATIAFGLAIVLSSCAPESTSTAPASASTALAPTQPAAPTALSLTATSAPAAPTSVPAVATSASLALTSPAFEANAPIPDKHSCNGGGVSPELDWSNAPANTKSFALVLEDPDAVSVAGHVWDHWVIFNIPPTTLSLPEALTHKAELPDGTIQGLNSSNGPGYEGPCPPSGTVHHYVFTLYALDTLVAAKTSTLKDDLLKAIDGHILAQTQLIGTYGK